MILKGEAACHFLLGYLAAVYNLRRKPTKDLLAACQDARDILTGGSFRGPLAVWDMEEYANRLAQTAIKRAPNKKPV